MRKSFESAIENLADAVGYGHLLSTLGPDVLLNTAAARVKELESELATLRARCQPQDGEPSVEEVREWAEMTEWDHYGQELKTMFARALLRRMGEDG